MILQDWLKKRNDTTQYLALFVTDKQLDIYHISQIGSVLVESNSGHIENFLLFAMNQLADRIKAYVVAQKMTDPSLIICIDAHTELICDSTFFLQDYQDLALQTLVLPSCYKIYGSFLKHEIVFQYYLLANLLNFKVSAVTNPTALHLELLAHQGKHPPVQCQTMSELHSWIEENIQIYTQTSGSQSPQIHASLIQGIILFGASL